jgi:hypothetical protein
MSFRLVHIVKAIDPKRLKVALKEAGLPGHNLIPFLLVIADMTNDGALQDGVWWGLEKLTKMCGLSKRSGAYLRDAGEKLGVLIVDAPGTKHRATTITISYQIMKYVDEDALICIDSNLATIENMKTLCEQLPSAPEPEPQIVAGDMVEEVFPFLAVGCRNAPLWGAETTGGVQKCTPGGATVAAETELETEEKQNLLMVDVRCPQIPVEEVR